MAVQGLIIINGKQIGFVFAVSGFDNTSATLCK